MLGYWALLSQDAAALGGYPLQPFEERELYLGMAVFPDDVLLPVAALRPAPNATSDMGLKLMEESD